MSDESKKEYTPKEAIKFFPWLSKGRGESTIRLWIKQGKIPARLETDGGNNPRNRRYKLHISHLRAFYDNHPRGGKKKLKTKKKK